MIQLRLVGEPDDVDTVLHALSEVVEVLAGRRKPSRDGDGRVLQYGAIAVLNPPAEPMYGLGDLARALGGAETSFTGRVLELVAKAQATPANLQRLALAFPREVRAYSIWMACNPTPTAEVLLALLDNAVLYARYALRTAGRDVVGVRQTGPNRLLRPTGAPTHHGHLLAVYGRRELGRRRAAHGQLLCRYRKAHRQRMATPHATAVHRAYANKQRRNR